MLKIAVLSMLLGAVALFASLTYLFSPASDPDRNYPPLLWERAAAQVELGDPSMIDGKLQVTLNSVGLAMISLRDWRVPAKFYTVLHFAVKESSPDMDIKLIWANTDREREGHTYTLENRQRTSLWLATNEIKNWEGDIHSLRMAIIGEPGDTITIEDFSLYRSSLPRQLLAIYSDFTAFIPWNRAAMNSHTGVTNVSSFYPVPLMVAYLSLSLLAYVILLLLFRAKLQFNWKVVALIFLACWISLDLAWQYRLLHQLATTHRTFAGKDSPGKLAVGPDAELHRFISEVKEQLEPGDTRIFVASSDEYQGLRGAYYLYPLNVYWSLHGAELPHSKFIHPGDYIVAINPTDMRIGKLHNKIGVPLRDAISAETIFSDPAGTLFRVK